MRQLVGSAGSVIGLHAAALPLLTCTAQPWQGLHTDAGLDFWPDSSKPIQQAATPPSSWYTQRSVAELERSRVFQRSWQLAGHVRQLASLKSFFTGSIAGMPYIVCRDELGELRAFHNVCSHHAAAVTAGSGVTDRFTCGYHGWQYDLQGRLRKATRLKGIEGFKAADAGLRPMRAEMWGPFIFIAHDQSVPLDKWLGEGGAALLPRVSPPDFVHVGQREYTLRCNWKVFCDNYLDGGYHVPFAHPGLADGLDMSSYHSELYENVSIQRVAASGHAPDRLSGGGNNGSATSPDQADNSAAYAFVYPNLMVNVYGSWIDTNIVSPLSADSCSVRFDWYLSGDRAGDQAYITDSLAASHQVQLEDVELCQDVQRGLGSPAYDAGRYAPSVETPMFHFHQRLWRDLFA